MPKFYAQDYKITVGTANLSTLVIMQDFGAGAVDALLFPLLGSTVAVKIVPTAGTVTATNPEYSMSCLVTQYQPFAGAVGDIATLSVTWPVSGEVTRATAPGA